MWGKLQGSKHHLWAAFTSDAPVTYKHVKDKYHGYDKKPMNKPILLTLVAFMLFAGVISSAYASNWGDGPFGKKLQKQAVNNKNVYDKYGMWLKHTGSANSPVCGIKICKAITISVSMPNGKYPLKGIIP